MHFRILRILKYIFHCTDGKERVRGGGGGRAGPISRKPKEIRNGGKGEDGRAGGDMRKGKKVGWQRMGGGRVGAGSGAM